MLGLLKVQWAGVHKMWFIVRKLRMYTFRSKISPTVFRAMSLGVILLSFWKVGARQPKNLLRGSTQEIGRESLLGSYLFSKICKEFLKILERIYMQ